MVVLFLIAVFRLPSSSLGLTTQLKAWNAKESANAAARATIDCSLCLTPRKGANCVALICSHVFCRDCLAKLWRVHMEEGDVYRIGCPDLECMKRERPLEASELRRVLADEEVEQWKRTKARLELEAGEYLFYLGDEVVC
jgi:E3 ubiquitin-protein ligase RNF14